MTFDLEYALQQFREEQHELFDEDGKCYKRVTKEPAMERMLKIINLFEVELNNSNMLHDFLNRSSDASPFEATEQEYQENEFKQWLQSRTAVKAEENEYYQAGLKEGWHRHELHNQSQPTAGGGREPFLMDQQQFQELSHDEKKEYRAQFKSQPSPSNPSIKRPTEEEIHTAYTKVLDKWRYGYGEFLSREECWNAAIDWFLSIQPDK